MNGEPTFPEGQGEQHDPKVGEPFRFEREDHDSTLSDVWDSVEVQLNDADPEQRWRAIHFLRVLPQTPGDKRILGALAHFSRHPDPLSRCLVAYSLGTQGKYGIPVLSQLAIDKDAKVREWVAGNLGNAGSAAIPMIKRLVHDPEVRVREAAASSVSLLSVRHRLLLIRILFRQDKAVRSWAKVWLWKGSAASIRFLVSAAEVGGAKGRNAQTLLERMGLGKEWSNDAENSP